MDDNEEIEWRKWRNALTLIPIVVQGMELAAKHSSDDEPAYMIAEAILAGPNGWYLTGDCPALGGRRTWAIDRIEWIRTPDEVRFSGVLEWLAHRTVIAPAVADQYGIILPPESARR